MVEGGAGRGVLLLQLLRACPAGSAYWFTMAHELRQLGGCTSNLLVT